MTKSYYYVNARLGLWTILRYPRDLPSEWQQTTVNGDLMLAAQREGYRQITSNDLADGFTVSIYEGDTCLVEENACWATIFPLIEAIQLHPKSVKVLREKIGQRLTLCFGDMRCWEVVIELIEDPLPHFAMLSEIKELFEVLA
ncbi:hypothetical protein A2X44_01675 [candidate division CPR3 bacterium GWF2_35_18]|nr:MAG: hypothetical protein A2X44_01675 [candidate division CPR3 bacterium GWF2_35_18]OGB65736.1 MAG: hypothetical protein A2250_01935 [candidate division CPR3 bacterium RIFOXYA2_FULL_35_13]